MDTSEPDIILYEEIPIPEDELEPGTSTDGTTSSSSSEDEAVQTERQTPSPFEGLDRTERLNAETIDMVLDSIFPPKRIQRGGKWYWLRLSRKVVVRNDITKLSQRFEAYLRKRQVRMHGYCAIRRELNDLLFDELIRQSTVSCPERGVLLLRIRDELKMTFAVSEKLLENGIAFGERKALEAEMEMENLQLQHAQLQAEIARSEERVRELRRTMKGEEDMYRQKMAIKQLRHEEKMDFLSKANRQLEEQMDLIAS